MNAKERSLLDRRRFLKAIGATALTLPFLRALPTYAGSDAGASGGGGGDPVYLVLLFTGLRRRPVQMGSAGSRADGCERGGHLAARLPRHPLRVHAGRAR